MAPAPALADVAGEARVRVIGALGGRLRARAGWALTPPRRSDDARVRGRVAEIAWNGDADGLKKALAVLRDPLIVRGGCASWTSSRAWTVEGLARTRGGWMCETRAPRDAEEATTSGRAFTYCEESHEAVRRGAFEAPSVTVRMPFAMALARVLGYGGGGGAYVQAELEEDMKRECEGGASDAFDSLGEESQAKRLWLSLAGSVTPLHYDASWSTLAQVGSGSKRMLLYQPFALASMALYPDWHPLRRRGRRFPKRQLAWEAIVEPGDVLIFPPRFAHYTESVARDDDECISMSVTQRFRREKQPRDDEAASNDDVASKFRRWTDHRDRPNSLSRLILLGLVDSHAGDIMDRDARTGEVAPIDVSGWQSSMNDEWRIATEECAFIVRECVGDENLLGIYCRGSVARGRARAKISDVYLIVIARANVNEDSIRDQISERWLPRFSHFIRKSDLQFEYASSETEVSDPALRFVLATQSVTVFGSPLPDSLPSSARIPTVQILNDIHDDISHALAHGSERAIVWVLKRLIRASFEKHALHHASGYTRDLFHCVQFASAHADDDILSDLATALVVCIHSPRIIYGEFLWRGLSEALVRRLETCLL